MMDHHFAERHPGHQHIYLGAANPEHSHEFQPYHSHNGLAQLLRASEAPARNVVGHIVFVAPAGGSAHGAAYITVPANAQSIRFGVEGRSGLLGHYLAREAIPPGASIAPPTHPPPA